MDLVYGDNKFSFVNTLVWVAQRYFRTDGIVAADFQLLLKLIKFLEDYAGISTEFTQDARIDINLRAKSRSEDAAWTQYRRTLYEQEKSLFFLTRRPVLEVQGVSPEDQADVLETEWAEFDLRRRHACLHNLGTGVTAPGPRCPPGISVLERAHAHAIAQGLSAGQGRNWLILPQPRGRNFPNQFSAEQYFRLAVLQQVERYNSTPLTADLRIPCSEVLSRAEKAIVRGIRGKVLQGTEICWANFEGRKGPHYKNELTKLQILALAAQLQPTERAPEPAAEAESGEEESLYFSAEE